jgi:hypothetical protein
MYVIDSTNGAAFVVPSTQKIHHKSRRYNDNTPSSVYLNEQHHWKNENDETTHFGYINVSR